MALTEETKNGSGTTLSFGIFYAKTTDIKVRIDGGTPLTFATDGTPDAGEYYIADDATSITFGESQSGKSVHIYRETDIDSASAVFTPGSSIKSTDLNQVELVTRLASQEGKRFDQFDPKLRGELDMTSKKITALANPTADADATNKTYVDTKVSDATATLTHSGTSAPAIEKLSEGDRWFDTDDGRTYVYHNNQWIDAAPQKESAVTSGALNAGSKTDITVSTNLASWTINDSAVDTAALADNSVTLAKMTDGSVDTSELVALAVTSGKIDSFAVSTSKIANDAVTSDKLQDHATTDTSRAVTTNHIRDNNVTQAKIADDAINEAKLQVSNDPTNEHVLMADATKTGGLKWGSGTTGVTSITAGTGLKVGNDTSGSITGSGTIDIDTGVNADQILQLDTNAKIPAVDGSQITNLRTVDTSGAGMVAQLPSSVGSGQSAKFLRADNTWIEPEYTTNTDTNTTYTAGTGLSLSNSNVFSVTSGTYAAADHGSHTDTTYTAGTGLSLSNNQFSVSGSYAASSHGTHVSSNSIDSDHYVDGSIDTAHIGDLQVTNAKIANGTIQGGKLADISETVTGVTNNKVSNIQNNKIYNRGTDINGSWKYQWLHTKTLQERINVKDYGAVGNGSTDDKLAIQNAINAVPSGGGVVYFPSGTYRITGKLTLSDTQNCIILEGCGADTGHNGEGSTIYQYDGVNTEFIEINGADNITIRHLLFRGGTFWDSNNANLGTTGGNGAITAYRTSNGGIGHLFEHLRFLGITQSIGVYGCGQCTIRNIIIQQVPNTDAGDCIKLDNNGNNRIDQVRIDGCIVDGSPYPGQASPNYTINTNVRGLGLYNEMVTIFVSNSSFIRCKSGIFINSSWDGDFLYFNNVEAERANEHGWDIAGPGNYINMVNCFASTNNQSGVALASSFNGVINITNLNARDNNDHGININCLAQQVSIVNPVIGGNNRNDTNNTNGISIGSSCNNISILGGKIGGSSTDLSGTGNQYSGISVNGNGHTNMRFIGVNVTGNSNSGIGWDASGTNVAAASDNFIKYCPGYSTGQTSFP